MRTLRVTAAMAVLLLASPAMAQTQLTYMMWGDPPEITVWDAIVADFEALHPDPPLFGQGALNIAEVDMWTRRVEMRLMTPLGLVWQHTHPWTARIVKPQYTEFGETQRPRVLAAMAEFDHALSGGSWLDGVRYTIADIVLLTTIDFATFVGIPVPGELDNLTDWHRRATARPSAQA